MTPTHSIKRTVFNKKRKYYYYRCTCTLKKQWKTCSTKQISADRLEKFISENFERIANDQEYLQHLVTKLNKIDKLNYAESSKKPAIFEGSPLGSGYELSGVSSKIAKITPTHIGQTLVHFIKELKEKKGIEKHLTAKKFIKNIIYSKEKITAILFLSNICDLHNAAERRPDFLGENSLFSDSFGQKKRRNCLSVLRRAKLKRRDRDSNPGGL